MIALDSRVRGNDILILLCHLRSSGLYARLCDGWIFTNNAHKGLDYGLFPAK